ncbi:MAG: hypothetical protein MK358_11495, partial [Vicinamibacterales bacterium]|nr:hypothetical protein [Vicinamibacterales bacterium]
HGARGAVLLGLCAAPLADAAADVDLTDNAAPNPGSVGIDGHVFHDTDELVARHTLKACVAV